MAKIKYTTNIGELGTLRHEHTASEMHAMMDVTNETNAVYVDGNRGWWAGRAGSQV